MVDSVRHVFRGQYLWLEATLAHEALSVSKNPGTVPVLAEQFSQEEVRLKNEWTQRTRALAARGKVAIWGAGAKGVTFANLVDGERNLVDCIVDLNPYKQGRFLPGTGHPIVSYQELGRRGVTSAILMNPNYRAENQALLRAAQLRIDLIE